MGLQIHPEMLFRIPYSYLLVWSGHHTKQCVAIVWEGKSTNLYKLQKGISPDPVQCCLEQLKHSLSAGRISGQWKIKLGSDICSNWENISSKVKAVQQQPQVSVMKNISNLKQNAFGTIHGMQMRKTTMAKTGTSFDDNRNFPCYNWYHIVGEEMVHISLYVLDSWSG